MNKTSLHWRTIIQNLAKTVEDATKVFPEYKHLTEKLKKSNVNIYDRICDVTKRKPEEFNVLCHGDMWANNVMFSYSGCTIDAIFCDFQVVNWSSPVLDIVYTLYTSSHSELRERDWDFLINYYYTELKNTLSKLKYSKPVPSLSELHSDILKKGIYAAYNGLVGLGLRNINVQDHVFYRFIDDTDEGRRYRLNIISKPECRSSFDFMLRYFDSKGFFD